MLRSLQSILLVTIQLAAIFFLLLTGPLIAMQPVWLALEILAGVVGLWALRAMGLRQLRVGPDVADKARFVKSGPYRFVRHPMYLSVLLFAGALVGNHFTWLRLAGFLILLADLVAKLTLEEKLLRERFSEYREYEKQTKRLVPFVY